MSQSLSTIRVDRYLHNGHNAVPVQDREGLYGKLETPFSGDDNHPLRGAPLFGSDRGTNRCTNGIADASVYALSPCPNARRICSSLYANLRGSSLSNDKVARLEERREALW